MRDITRLLAAKALLNKEDGKINQALKDCLLSFKVNKSLKEPLLLSQLARRSYNEITLDTLEKILQSTNGNPTMLFSLIKEIEEQSSPLPFTKPLEADRCFAINELNKFILETRKWPPSLLLCLTFFVNTLSEPFSKMNEVCCLKLMKRVIILSQIPYYKNIQKAKKLGEEIENLPFYYFFPKAVLSALTKINLVQARNEARMKEGILALTLKIYKEKYGDYPESLNKLTPEILTSLPLDPFTGKNYIYRKKDQGFIVYSLGDNLEDDGGKSHRGMKWKGDFDIVWEG